MSIFGSILSAVGLGSSTQTASATPASTSGGEDGLSPSTTDAGSPASGTAASPSVDVASLLQQRAEAKGEPLNYQSSIVDLLKVLDLPSDLHTRTALAHELHYNGSSEDTAEMNTWLHGEVMAQLENNGGSVPDDWKHAV